MTLILTCEIPTSLTGNDEKCDGVFSTRFPPLQTAHGTQPDLRGQSRVTSEFSLYANQSSMPKILFGAKVVVKTRTWYLSNFFYFSELSPTLSFFSDINEKHCVFP